MPFNFGQQPFIHTPPTGYKKLQTQNLPAADIVDGREHFQALTAPGSGTVGPNEIEVNPYTNPTGYLDNPPPYPPSNAFNTDEDLWFYVPTNTNYTETAIKFDTPMTGTTFRVYVSIGQSGFQVNGTTISGNGAGWFDISAQAAGSLSTLGFSASSNAADGFSRLQIDGKDVIEKGILPKAQSTFPTGLWWIKSRKTDANTNEHQLVDSVRNATNPGYAFRCPTYADNTSYVTPAGNCVAWCWNYNDADPSINGFSIRQFTTSGGANTVTHNLGKAPEFIIMKGAETSIGWYVYHKDLNPGNYLLLHAKFHARLGRTCIADVNDTTCNLLNTFNASLDNQAYLWTSVPNYSAFGSYQGNNSVNGPFCWCGFRPALVLLKCAGEGSDWIMLDSTRDMNNPADTRLRPNQAAGENEQANNAIDILSNGFKIRGEQTNVNENNQPFVWAAWAENPFGGSNTSPANAR